ncbi:MAG TPA: hypothetical protein VFB42_06875 [Gaiellaceae bacterium]|nr:hypothetical protein [Gaiellaceae bacterium]
MDDPDSLRGTMRLLATQVYALTVAVDSLAAAVARTDLTERAALLEPLEHDLLQLNESLRDLIRSLDGD